MMYNTRYLPGNVEQHRLEKTILRHFPYNLNLRSRWTPLIQDGRKNHEGAYYASFQDKCISGVCTESGPSRCVVDGSLLTTFLPARS